MCGGGTNGVEEPAGLAQLLVVGSQLRLKAAVLVQQVGHQQAGEVGTAGARQHLVLHLRGGETHQSLHRYSRGDSRFSLIQNANT